MINRLRMLGSIGMVFIMCLSLSGAVALAQDEAAKKDNAPKQRKVAIFVKNRAKNVPDDKVSVLEDLIAAQVTDLGFSIISREEVLNSVAAFASAGPNRGDPNDPGAKLDAILSSNTSALRLAQNMGAAYIMYPAITTYGTSTANYNGEKVRTSFVEHRMRVTTKITNANEGGSETADTIEVTKRFMQTEQLRQETDVINDLLAEAAVVLGEKLKKKVDANKIPEATVAAEEVPFTVICGMSDLSVPEIVKDDKGEWIITANRYQIQAMAVNVAIDGIVVGTTEGSQLFARPGIHKLSLTRDGFKPVTQTINIRKNGIYNFPMQMDTAGYARFRENSKFLNDLKTGTRLNEAQVKAIEGFAQMLQQSGFKVNMQQDAKSDVKVNTTQPMQYQQQQFWR